MNAMKKDSVPVTPLARTALKVVIIDLLAEFEVHHTFRNDGGSPIEAVYSFPMPLDAAFIGLQATLAGETLSAQVLPAQAANRTYDEAIGEGHSAILLEQLEPGMLCVNLGNLMPGEEGDVVLRFAAMLNVSQATARFSLPLVHRPRYGRSRLDEIVQPRNDFAIEHPLEAEVRICGLLASRPIQCATPGVVFAREQNNTVLRVGRALLDRDFVLTFDVGVQPVAHAQWIADGEDGLCLASFTVPPDASAGSAPRDICLLLDGSGSMQGDAIVQSRRALAAIADALDERDRIQVIRFGTSTSALFRRPLQASARVKETLRALQDTVQADLGGTEMAKALRAGLASLVALDCDTQRKVIILVTDGAVNGHEIEDARHEAMRLGIRVFVVAVGSSAGVDALAPLAEATRARLERAVPSESIDAGVLRQLSRARTEPARIEVTWTGGAVATVPLGIVYPGDAATAVARIAGRSNTSVTIRFPSKEASIAFSASAWTSSPAGRAWVGQHLYRQATPDSEEREMLALRYSLITPETKAVLVKHRATSEQALELPIVTPVPHMLPAGLVSHHIKSLRVAQCAIPGLTSLRLSYQRMDVSMFQRRVADSKSSRKEVAPSPPKLDPVAMAELVSALWMFVSGPTCPHIEVERFVHHVSPACQEQVRDFLVFRQFTQINLANAIHLLDELLACGAVLDLSDDQEAQLATILRG